MSIQTPNRASMAWSMCNTRPTPSIFPFHLYPGLVSTVDEVLPATDRGILMGGGRGHLGALLRDKRPRMQVLNLDIADIVEPLVQTMKWDMEMPMPRDRVAKPDERISVIAPFSMEYTDIAKSTDAIAQLLRTGEILVWICHHKYSPITVAMRSGLNAGLAIEAAANDVITNPAPNWLGIAQRTERQVMAAFELPITAPVIDMITEQDLMDVIRSLIEGERKNERLADAMRGVIALVRGARHPETREHMTEVLASLAQRFRGYREMVGPMVQLAPITAGEVLGEVSKELRPLEAVKIEQKFTNLRYDVFDETRDGIPLPICFVMAFERV